MAQQLERMADAMRSLSYEGTLVYLHDNRLEALRIQHRVENGQSHERLESLNGPVRTVTREQDRVTCKLSSARPISVHRVGIARDILRTKTVDPEALSAHYLVHPLGAARVAGRQTDVVGIIPRDNFRYGYRFYLDLETGLPLKSDLMGKQAEPVEQVMFTSLELLPSEGESTVTDAEGDEREQGAETRELLVEDTNGWNFAVLPPGFKLVMFDHLSDDDQPTKHFVLSDGLASVSVYVENGVAEGLSGESRIGAVSAVGGRISGHQVTVVGEVPAATAKAILAGLRYDGEGADD